MAKPIQITPEFVEEIKQEFNAMLTKAKLCDGRITFSKNFSTINRKARVFFSEVAWLKMTTLIEGCSQEVGWYATARRLDTESDDYLIGDILVYPQTVTAATVEMDEQECSKWFMENCEDERFEEIHCQMHSHVNMGVTPSATDISHQEEIVNQLRSENFYIFMIWNKRHEVNIKIYDMKKNIMFESSDVTWSILDGDYALQKFLTDAKALVKQRTYVPTYQPGAYNPYVYGNSNSGSQPTKTIGGVTVKSTAVSPEASDDKKESKKDKKNKKDKKKTKFRNQEDDKDAPVFLDKNGLPYDMSDAFAFSEGPLYTA